MNNELNDTKADCDIRCQSAQTPLSALAESMMRTGSALKQLPEEGKSKIYTLRLLDFDP